jgi:hypothetical protein
MHAQTPLIHDPLEHLFGHLPPALKP